MDVNTDRGFATAIRILDTEFPEDISLHILKFLRDEPVELDKICAFSREVCINCCGVAIDDGYINPNEAVRGTIKRMFETEMSLSTRKRILKEMFPYFNYLNGFLSEIIFAHDWPLEYHSTIGELMYEHDLHNDMLLPHFTLLHSLARIDNILSVEATNDEVIPSRTTLQTIYNQFLPLWLKIQAVRRLESYITFTDLTDESPYLAQQFADKLDPTLPIRRQRLANDYELFLSIIIQENEELHPNDLNTRAFRYDRSVYHFNTLKQNVLLQ